MVAWVISQASSQTRPMDIDEDAHQLGDGDRRVGVVELDRDLVGEAARIAELLDVAADEVLQRGRGEEELLAEAEFLAGCRIGGGIEHAGDGFGAAAVGERAEWSPRLKASSSIGSMARDRHRRSVFTLGAAPADDRRVVGDGEDLFGRLPGVAENAVGVGLAGRPMPPKPIS